VPVDSEECGTSSRWSMPTLVQAWPKWVLRGLGKAYGEVEVVAGQAHLDGIDRVSQHVLHQGPSCALVAFGMNRSHGITAKVIDRSELVCLALNIELEDSPHITERVGAAVPSGGRGSARGKTRCVISRVTSRTMCAVPNARHCRHEGLGVTAPRPEVAAIAAVAEGGKSPIALFFWQQVHQPESTRRAISVPDLVPTGIGFVHATGSRAQS
jgi:hypothetical protein